MIHYTHQTNQLAVISFLSTFVPTLIYSDSSFNLLPVFSTITSSEIVPREYGLSAASGLHCRAFRSHERPRCCYNLN